MKLRLAVLLVILGVILGSLGGSLQPVKAQTPVALSFTGNLPHTSCPLTASTTTFCFASDGFYWSNAGATFVIWTGGASAGVQKVNGVAPGSTGNVTVSCGPSSTPITNVTVTPAISATGATATVTASGSVPSMTVAAPTCTATGS